MSVPAAPDPAGEVRPGPKDSPKGTAGPVIIQSAAVKRAKRGPAGSAPCLAKNVSPSVILGFPARPLRHVCLNSLTAPYL